MKNLKKDINKMKKIKFIKYNINYHKKDKCYYLWKTLLSNEIPLAFNHIYAGTRYQCIKYAKENKIKLNELIKLPS